MRQNRYKTGSTRRHFTWLLLAVGFLTGLSIAAVSPATAQPISKPDPALEEAILAENWEKIVRLLPEEMEPNLPAPLRLVKGHACLATNRNNESLCLFLGASSEVDLRDWEEWTQTFVRDNPGSPIVYYFRGDARARLKDWDQTLSNFDTALSIDPNHVLVLHSRAVAMALNRRWDDAREDLRSCRRLAPRFAEAHVSWGTYIVRRRTDPKIALAAFDLALKYSPDYVLALNGKGSMETIIGDLERAAEHLQRAHDLAGGCLSDAVPMIGVNELVLAARMNEEIEKNIARATGIEPGMTLQEKMMKFDSLSPMQRQGIFDAVANARHHNQMRQGDIFTPDSWKFKSTTSGEIGVVGNVPYAKIGGSRQFELGKDMSRVTSHNINQQSALLDSVARKYGIQASPGYNSVGNNIKSFFNNQFGPGRDFAHSGGVSSEQIEDTLDRGDWKVVVVYGLLYADTEETETQHEEDES